MAGHTTMITISQFNGTNFNNWKYRVSILFNEKDLRRYIENSSEDILSNATANTHDAIKLEEKKCISILVQTICDAQFEYIKEKKTVKEMFDTLCGVFKGKSTASQLLLRKQLLTMKCNESEDIKDHFFHFDKIVHELKSTGAKIEDLDVVVYLLLTLPKSYNNLVTVLETIDQSKLSLEFVKTRLMDESNKRGNYNSGKQSESGAMNAKRKKKRIICYRCNEPNHIKISVQKSA